MPKRSLPFGAVLGYGPGGVPAFSSDYDNIAPGSAYRSRGDFISIVAGVYCGFKHQCVAGARRFLVLTRSVTFPDVGMAYEIFSLPYFLTVTKRQRSGRRNPADDDDDDEVEASTDDSGEDNEDHPINGPTARRRRGGPSRRVPVHHVENGGNELPVLGSLLIWHEGGFFKHTGHVAVVTEATEQYVRIFEQNVHDESWNGRNYSRELVVETTVEPTTGRKRHFVHEHLRGARVMGWVTPLFDERHVPLVEPEEMHAVHGIEPAEVGGASAATAARAARGGA